MEKRYGVIYEVHATVIKEETNVKRQSTYKSFTIENTNWQQNNHNNLVRLHTKLDKSNIKWNN